MSLIVPWAQMPRGVRVLVAALIALVALETVRYSTPWLHGFEPGRDVIYNGILLGSAALCLLRAVLVR